MEMDAALLRTLPQAAPGLVVGELGCGLGGRCRLWHQHGHLVHGIDHDPARIGMARKLARGTDIGFDLARACALPWPGGSMDLCLVHGAIALAPDWAASLAELARVLRPGGAAWLAGGWRDSAALLAPLGLYSPPGSMLAFKSGRRD